MKANDTALPLQYVVITHQESHAEHHYISEKIRQNNSCLVKGYGSSLCHFINTAVGFLKTVVADAGS